MAASTKRVLTEAAYALNHAGPTASGSSSLPTQLNVELQNVGRRVRQSVAEGYKTQRFLPLDASRTTTQDDLNVNYFRSDVDTLRAVFSSSSRGLQRFCDAGDAPSWSRQPDDGVADPSARTSRKRSAKGMEDDDDDTPKASDEDGDVAMPLGQVTVNDRTVKGTPKRFMRATQSLPVGRFAFSGGPVASVGVGAFSAAPHGQSGFGTFPTAVDTVARDGVPDFGEFFDKDDF